jgi:hypothetical protein
VVGERNTEHFKFEYFHRKKGQMCQRIIKGWQCNLIYIGQFYWISRFGNYYQRQIGLKGEHFVNIWLEREWRRFRSWFKSWMGTGTEGWSLSFYCTLSNNNVTLHKSWTLSWISFLFSPWWCLVFRIGMTLLVIIKLFLNIITWGTKSVNLIR